MKYDAFISYNHDADGALAPALQDALQHLAKPWYRRRSMEVFRDETNLSASPELFAAIRQGLDDSRYYVLLASPGSAASTWVGNELEYWRATKTAASQRIVLALTDGELVWDSRANRFDPEQSTALHPALLDTFSSEPLHVDLRDAHVAARDGDRRTFRRRFRHSVAKIAARIREVAPDELEGEDLRQHRRTLRLAWGAAAVLLLLTVASVFGLVSARRNADRADRQAAAALAQLRTARSSELAATALSYHQIDDPAEAVRLAILANRVADTPQARSALMTVVGSSNGSQPPATPIAGWGPASDLSAAIADVSPDGRTAVLADASTGVVMIDLRRRQVIAAGTRPGITTAEAVAIASDRTVAAQLADGQVVQWSAQRRKPVVGHASVDSSAGAPVSGGVAVSADGRLLAFVVHDIASPEKGTLTVLDVATGEVVQRSKLRDLPDGITDVRFGGRGRDVMVRAMHGLYLALDTGGSRSLEHFPAPKEYVDAKIDPGSVFIPGADREAVAVFRYGEFMSMWRVFGNHRSSQPLDIIAAVKALYKVNSPTIDPAVIESRVSEFQLRFSASADGLRLVVTTHAPNEAENNSILIDAKTGQLIGRPVVTTGSPLVAEGFSRSGNDLVGVGLPGVSSPTAPSVVNHDLAIRPLLAEACAVWDRSGTELPDRTLLLGALDTTTPRMCPDNSPELSARIARQVKGSLNLWNWLVYSPADVAIASG